MIVKCSWCKQIIEEKTPYDDCCISHSICKSCNDKQFFNFKELFWGIAIIKKYNDQLILVKDRNFKKYLIGYSTICECEDIDDANDMAAHLMSLGK